MDKLKLIEAILGAQCSTQESDCAFNVGESVYIRTVTHHQTGKIKAIKGNFLVLSEAAWIADSGRFYDALKTGSLSEIEPAVGDVRVNIESIIDCYEWKHALPKDQK